jgi:hypothetical protein
MNARCGASTGLRCPPILPGATEPVAAEFKGDVPVLQTEIWQALKPAKHAQLIKMGHIKIEPQWGRASSGRGSLCGCFEDASGRKLHAVHAPT